MRQHNLTHILRHALETHTVNEVKLFVLYKVYMFKSIKKQINDSKKNKSFPSIMKLTTVVGGGKKRSMIINYQTLK